MNYYDGNTVTAMWNYAQHFALNDNSFGTTFGPSAPGAINLVSGNTGGIDTAHSVRGALTPSEGDTVADGTRRPEPHRRRPALLGRLLQPRRRGPHRHQHRRPPQRPAPELGLVPGRLHPQLRRTPGHRTRHRLTTSSTSRVGPPARPPTTSARPSAGRHDGAKAWGTKADYIPHHEPFQYYSSTANPHHLAPKSLSVVGTDTATPGKFNTANHQYDMSTFDDLVSAIHQGKLSSSHLPAVSFLKAPGYEDGHAAYSDPIDEQRFVVRRSTPSRLCPPGPAPPSSWPMTTPTASTTTCTAG